MKPYRIEKKTGELVQECESFSEGWDALKELFDSKLVRASDGAVLAEKHAKVNDKVPFILLVSTGAPITTRN
jgi:hypothetical protein